MARSRDGMHAWIAGGGGPAAIRVVAHRGASAVRPENTLAAFDEALALGCDAIELDVQATRDGVPVIFHDRSVRKLGGGLRPLARLSWRELRRLDAGAWFAPRFRGLRVPSLDEVLARYAGRTRLLIEIKRRGPAEAVSELAEAVALRAAPAGGAGRAVILCYDLAVLRRCQRAAPGLPVALNLEPPPRYDAAFARRVARIDALSADVGTLTPAFAERVRRSGRPLFVFTCNDERRLRRAIAARPDAIMSDRPDWLRARLGAAGGGR